MAVIQSEYFSQAMRGFVSFSAVLPIDLPPTATLPPRYAGGPWPTLYLLHGYSGARNDWLKNSPVESLAARYGIAVIIVDALQIVQVQHNDRIPVPGGIGPGKPVQGKPVVQARQQL